MEIGLYKAKSELERIKNELETCEERKYNILETIDKLDPRPKSSRLKGVVVSSSFDTKSDKLSEYVAIKEKYADELILLETNINYYKKEIKTLNKFIEKEEKRLTNFNEWHQKIIYMREAKCSWIQIACSVPYSERQCRNIYYKYKKDCLKVPKN